MRSDTLGMPVWCPKNRLVRSVVYVFIPDEGRSVALARRTSLAVDGRESSIQWRSGNDAATTIECAIDVYKRQV